MKHTLVTISVVVLTWELLIKGGYIPGLWDITTTFFTLSVDPDFLYNLWTSLWRLVVGWSIGMLIGTTIGIFMGSNIHVKKIFMPVVSCLFPIPKIALLPLFIVLLGIGELSKITTIFIGAFFPSILNAYNSVIRTPTIYVEASRSCGAGYWPTLRKIVLPYSMPTIIAGFRTSGSLSLVLLVAAEMLGSKYGLGNWIFITGGEMDFAEMFAGIIWLSIIGLGIGWGTEFLKRRFCGWIKYGEGV
jgi:NitT/TauT family transport system permease protein